jgi:hypothetical protein
LRIFPSSYTELAFRRYENHYHERLVVYLHPWELDPEQPRIQGPLKSRLRHYTNLKRMHSRLGAVLERHRFVRFCDVPEEEALGFPIGAASKEENLVSAAMAGAESRGQS